MVCLLPTTHKFCTHTRYVCRYDGNVWTLCLLSLVYNNNLADVRPRGLRKSPLGSDYRRPHAVIGFWPQFGHIESRNCTHFATSPKSRNDVLWKRKSTYILLDGKIEKLYTISPGTRDKRRRGFIVKKNRT